MITKAYPKTQARSEVAALAKWAREERERLKEDCALEIMELVTSEDPNKYQLVQEKMEKFQADTAEMAKIIRWCDNGQNNG